MTVTTNRRAVLGAGAACLATPALAATATQDDPRGLLADGQIIAIARRIAALCREKDANKRALEAAFAQLELPPDPPELMMTYRGPLGPLKVEADPEWIRETIPNFSPLSKRGRRLRRLLRVHEEHYARLNAAREAAVGPLLAERERIQAELDTAFKEVLSMSGMSDVELNSALMEARFGAGRKHVPAFVRTYVEALAAA